MDHGERKNDKKTCQLGEFPFGKFEKIAEMMRTCCPGEGDLAECCSMMKKMMVQRGEGRKKRKGGTVK